VNCPSLKKSPKVKKKSKYYLDNSVGAVKALEVSVVVVAAEGDGHLAADGRVPDGGKGGGKTAIDPTLLEVPEW